MSGRVLKFKHNMPFALESKLCHRYGYAVEQRVVGQFISFKFSPKPPPSNVVQMTQPILATRQSELLKRCDNIVEFFLDPYNSQRAVRTRLHNMSQTLTAAEQQFVHEYMDDNFPVSDKGI